MEACAEEIDARSQSTLRQNAVGDVLTVTDEERWQIGRVSTVVRENGWRAVDAHNCWRKAHKELRVLLDDDTLSSEMPPEGGQKKKKVKMYMWSSSSVSTLIQPSFQQNENMRAFFFVVQERMLQKP